MKSAARSLSNLASMMATRSSLLNLDSSCVSSALLVCWLGETSSMIMNV
ncbi:unnamed protein product [Prunus brigantina]